MSPDAPGGSLRYVLLAHGERGARKFRAEHAVSRRHRFEHYGMSNNFAAVCSDHFYGRDFTRTLADVKVRGSIYVDAPFRQINAAFGIMRKTLQEFIANCNHLVGLLAGGGDLPCEPEHPRTRETSLRTCNTEQPRPQRGTAP